MNYVKHFISFTHSPVDGHFGVSSLGLSQIKLQ